MRGSNLIEKAKEILEQFPSKKVIVLGDYYLDEYLHCTAEQFSPEAPVPRAIIQKTEHVPGCAANVALVFKNLGAQVLAAGVIGNDEKGSILRNQLLEKGVMTTSLLPDMTRVTGVFSRILLENAGDTKQHFVRFDLENKEPISPTVHQALKNQLDKELAKADLLFVADYDEYGTGLITNTFLKDITELAKKHKTKLVGISRLKMKNFKDFDVIVCNKKEAGEATNRVVTDDASLKMAADQLLQEANVNTAIITKGKEGVAIAKRNQELVSLPTFAESVKDVCGAGDALSSTYALTSLTQSTEHERGFVASHAAAVAVSKMGTAPVYPIEIAKSISSETAHQEKIYREWDALYAELETLKQEGKKIVFTNGYFDLIHSGQIDFLKQAKAQGDILVVGINSDRSSKENKGEGRPILGEKDRVNVLSSMSFVDFVTVFDELTPLRIISTLKPCILAKGGTHKIDEIVGKNIVESHGGEVKLLPLTQSTNAEQLINNLIKSKGQK
jgi:D-beta-D-heptose 7-phosphate kinase / D-beta-D-heptose 1-phosphate adenosyltransferase